MSDTNSETLYWSDVYLKGQEEFLRRLNQMGAGVGASTMPGTSGPDWFAMFAPGFAGAAADAARKYFGSYDQYLGAARQFWELSAKAMANPDPAARAQQFIGDLQSLQPQFAQLWSGMGAFAPGMGGFAPNASGFAAGIPGFPQGIGGGGEMPALGLTRERQESMRRLQNLLSGFAQQQSRLAALWNEIIGDALKLYGERVGARLTSGNPPSSAKELYDLWIESGETAYAKAAHGPAYAKAQADLGNTLARLRIEQREIVESWSRQLDLPTRAEINTVHRRIKELRSELRRLSEQSAGARAAPTSTAAATGRIKRKARSSK